MTVILTCGQKAPERRGSLEVAGLGPPTAVPLRDRHKGTSSKHQGVYQGGGIQKLTDRPPTRDPLKPASKVPWGHSQPPQGCAVPSPILEFISMKSLTKAWILHIIY